MQVKDLCIVCANNYKASDKWNEFYYLDTGNLTQNRILELQHFQTEKKLPSRAKQKVSKGNILYSSVRPNQQHYGYYEDEHPNLLVSTGFIVLSPREDLVNGKFLYYFLTQNWVTNKLQSLAQNNVSAYPSISKEDILNIEINLPNRKTQDKIVNILSKIDNQIKHNNETVKRLQVLIQTTYSVMFEQYLNKITVFNTELKREIPHNWTVKQLRDLIELQNGLSYREQDLSSGIPMINLNSFNLDGTYKVDGIKKYGGKYKKENISQPYDLLISKTDVTRNRDIICKSILTPDFYDEDVIFTSDIAKVNCHNISKFYLNSMFNSKSFHNYIKEFANGTVVLHLVTNGLLDFKIPYPNDDTFTKFDDIVVPIYKQIYILMKENLELTKLKNYLLPRLINNQFSD